MSVFAFKHFTIRQTHAAMKVGTDAMLLGSIATWQAPQHLLDIGTGTGVLSLMIAQRYPGLSITAVEQDRQAFEDARFNFRQPVFPDCNKSVVLADIRSFEPHQLFDAIVANPPYFEQSFKSHDRQRNSARHTDDQLSFDELLACVNRMLSEQGVFWVILPHAVSEKFTQLALANGLFRQQFVRIFGKPRQVVRTIMAFARSAEKELVSEYTVRTLSGSYTAEYIALTQAYHAKALQ